NDDALARRLRLMHNFGFDGYDSVVELGINGKMSEASAAMGLTSLESIGDYIAVNRHNYEAYRFELSGIPGLRLLEYDDGAQNNFQYIVVEFEPDHCRVTRDEVAALCS